MEKALIDSILVDSHMFQKDLIVKIILETHCLEKNTILLGMSD